MPIARTTLRLSKRMSAAMLATVACLAMSIAVINPAPAKADSGSYNLIYDFLQPGTWGGWAEPPYDETNYYMTYAWAAYEGSGSAAVCEQVQRDSESGWVIVSSQCGTNQAWSGYLWRYRVVKRIRVKNDSPYAHTIKGYYSWSY